MIIRMASENDAQQILDIYAPYVENTVISFETSAPSIQEMKARISHTLQNNPWLVIEKDNEILGYAYASKHRERSSYRWSVDVSVYVKKDCHGKGIGKALYTSLFAILRLQGYCNAYAGICLPNEKSVGIHEYFGFKKIAQYNKVGYKSGHWHDVGWWELFLNQHDSMPADPLPVNAVDKALLIEAFNQSTGILPDKIDEFGNKDC